MKTKLVSLIALISLQLLNAQDCDYSADGIGDFENANYNQWNYLNTASGSTIGIFSQETVQTHSGSSAVSVDVTSSHPWGMRMFPSCDFTIEDSKTYTVSFWVYGGNGKTISLAMFYTNNGNNTIDARDINLTSNGWEKYEVTMSSNVNVNNAKFRLTFINAGSYIIDDFEVISNDIQAPIQITPDNSNFRYTGVAANDINSLRASFYRFPENYATNSESILFQGLQVGLKSAARAAASAGVSIEFSTNSQIITAKFQEDPAITGDMNYLPFAVYKNGELYNVFGSTDDLVEFTFYGNPGETSNYRITLPTFAKMNFLGLDIDQDAELFPLANDDRPVYVAIGNSITQGTGQQPASTHLTYPWLVADSLNLHLYNWGIGGSKINEGIYDNFSNAGITPDIVTVLWGYNDINCSQNCNDDDYVVQNTLVYYENLMTNLASSFPNTAVVAILPTFSTSTPQSTVRSLENIRAQQEDILTTLQNTYNNVCYFNGNEVTDAGSLSDQVHLNNTGAVQLANRIIEEINNCNGIITGLENPLRSKSTLKIHPNPSFSTVNLSESVNYTIFNINGEVILEGKGSNFDITDIPSGIYFLKTIYGVDKIIKL